jgi:hypothetical protein
VEVNELKYFDVQRFWVPRSKTLFILTSEVGGLDREREGKINVIVNDI